MNLRKMLIATVIMSALMLIRLLSLDFRSSPGGEAYVAIAVGAFSLWIAELECKQ